MVDWFYAVEMSEIDGEVHRMSWIDAGWDIILRDLPEAVGDWVLTQAGLAWAEYDSTVPRGMDVLIQYAN